VGTLSASGTAVSVMNEDRPLDLLREMARKRILVEICLTSNDVILGRKGQCASIANLSALCRAGGIGYRR